MRLGRFWILLSGLSFACGETPPEPPNIVLISIDSLRADHVGAYGYPRDTTPAMDRLATEGTLFENVVADSSWTLPAHVTMMTGLSSLAHGVDEFAGGRIAPAHTTVAERLSEAGYATYGIYSGPYLHPVFGLGRGFDHYEGVFGETLLDGAGFDLDEPDAARRITVANARAHETVTSPLITDKAVDFLREVGDERFFLFLHYFDVHYDYIPPEEMWRRFDPDYQGSLNVENYRRNDAIHRDMDPEELEHVVARYDGEILFTDASIGRLVHALDGLGLSENTLVAVTSDHGEAFFEHGNKGHGRTLFDEVLMVPLILRLPERVPAGARIQQQVRHLDLAPTLLSFAGLEASLEGRSLVEAWSGDASFPSLPALSTLRRNGHWLSLRKPGLKFLVHRDGSAVTETIYELRGDPGEKTPLPLGADQPSATRDELHRELRIAVLWAEALRKQGAEGSMELPEELKEQLRSLGYIQ